MDKIKKDDEQSQSKDILADNIKQLLELFPSVSTEGEVDGAPQKKIDFDALKKVLGEYVEDKEERYNFTWHGKANARRLAQTPSAGTLRPCKEESVDWDTTKNLFIEGDNLEVLKLLQKSYHKKVKMIYIDPPYNTGNEFIYPDKYQDNLDTYLKYTGQIDDEGFKVSANSETSGKYHTNWLNMIYPRIKVARNLLSNDGVIAISIGHDEHANLRTLCNEVFGEDNFITSIARMMKSGGAKGRFFTPNIDHILIFAKDINYTNQFRSAIPEEQIKTYYNKVESKGAKKGELYGEERIYKASLDARPNQRYWIECPDGSYAIPPGELFPSDIQDGEKIKPTPRDGVWKWTYPTYKDALDNGNIVFKKSSQSPLLNQNRERSKYNLYNKLWLKEQQEKGKVPSDYIANYENRQSSSELKKLNIPFDFAKPVNLIEYLIEITRSESHDLILDFFAGSASTAHSVYSKNSSDNLTRRFICIQLPELISDETEAKKKGFNTIADIGKERIRRAAHKIKEDNPGYQGDLGFKVFKLDATNINPWEADFDNLESVLANSEDSIKKGRSPEDVLYEILLKYGLDLTLPIKEHNIANKTVFDVGMGALLVCLDDEIPIEVAEGIGKLKEELQPEVMRVVFKDAGFADDVVKTNTLQVLKQFGIDDVKSI